MYLFIYQKKPWEKKALSLWRMLNLSLLSCLFQTPLTRVRPNPNNICLCPICPTGPQTSSSQQGSHWNGSGKASQADWVKLIILSRHNESISSAPQLSTSTVATHLVQLDFTQALCKGWQPWCGAVSFKQINLQSGETRHAYLGQRGD